MRGLLQPLFAKFNTLSQSDRVRRVSQRRVVSAIHDESSLDQRYAYGLAVHSHPASDRPHRDTRSGQPHRLRLLVQTQTRTTTRHVTPTKMRKHRGPVNAEPLSESLHTHPGQVTTDERVHLDGGEKSLSRLDSPHNRTPMVPHGTTPDPPGDLVDPTIQAVDQGLRLGGGVAEPATQAPRRKPALTSSNSRGGFSRAIGRSRRTKMRRT